MALSNLLRHFSNYSLGSFVVILAGLVSFPLLTRLLGVEEYGHMSLVIVTLTPLVAIGKSGLQHSATMFYAETRSGKNPWRLEQYFSTLFFGMMLSGTLVTLLWIALVRMLDARDEMELAGLFTIAAPLIFVRVLHSGMLNILRAQERSAAAATWQVVHRYIILLFVVVTLLLVEASVRGFLYASVAAETLVLLLLGWQVLRGRGLKGANFSPGLFRAMVIFGFPMVGFELAGAAANLGDRYVIKWLLGAAELGKYAAAYNLSEYVASALVTALATAILPMYLRVWAEQGAEATSLFLTNSLKLYMFVAVPLAAGFSAVAEDFLSLLASDEYSEGASTIPWIIFGLVVNGVVVMLAAGLYVTRQSRKLMFALGGSAALNLILNVIMVPYLGIDGAALATLVTYLIYAFAARRMAMPWLLVTIPWRNILVYGLAAAVMYVAVVYVHLDTEVLSLAAKIAVGILVYGAVVAVFDRESRELLHRLRHRDHG